MTLAMSISPALASAAQPLYRVDPIAPPATAHGEGFAVNAGGDVAGEVDGAAFVWHAGKVIRFPGVPFTSFDGPYTSVATALNKYGVAGGHDGNYQPCVMSGLQLATAMRFANGKASFVDASRNGLCGFEVDGINDAGVLVGSSAFRGFVRYPGGREISVKPLSTRPVDNGTRASAIDNEGRVVGGTTIDARTASAPEGYSSYVIHAFEATFEGGIQRMRDLGGLSRFPDTYATAISEDGTVVGYSGLMTAPKTTTLAGPSHAWMWHAGRMTDLGGATSRDSFAYGVNDRGVVVGCAGDHAVRWVDKHIQDLNALIDPHSGWQLTCARAINRSGVIVGTGIFGGRTLPFRLVPTR